MQSTNVRIDVTTNEEFKKLTAHRGANVGVTVKLAVRRLRQDQIGEELRGRLSESERAWLDAGLILDIPE